MECIAGSTASFQVLIPSVVLFPVFYRAPNLYNCQHALHHPWEDDTPCHLPRGFPGKGRESRRTSCRLLIFCLERQQTFSARRLQAGTFSIPIERCQIHVLALRMWLHLKLVLHHWSSAVNMESTSQPFECNHVQV